MPSHKTRQIVVRKPSLLDLPPSRRLLRAFLDGKQETTIRAYRRDLEDFRVFCGARNLDGATGELLKRGQGPANELALAYRQEMQGRKLSPATINRRLSALRSLVKLARTFGMVPFGLDVPNLKRVPYRDTRGPGLSGFRKMLRAIEHNGAHGARDRAILRLLFDLALRREEVVSLDVSDLVLEAQRIAVLRKGNTQRRKLTLPPQTIRVLRAWLGYHPTGKGPLFTNFDRAGKGDGRLTAASVYHVIRRTGERAGLRVWPHGLRHAGITEAVKQATAAGIGLEEVLDFSGHANVDTLMIYRDRERDVQGQLARLVAGSAPEPRRLRTRPGRRRRRRSS